MSLNSGHQGTPFMDASAPTTSTTAGTDHQKALWRPEQPRGGQGHHKTPQSRLWPFPGHFKALLGPFQGLCKAFLRPFKGLEVFMKVLKVFFLTPFSRNLMQTDCKHSNHGGAAKSNSTILTIVHGLCLCISLLRFHQQT